MKNQPLHPLFHSSAVDRDALVDPPPDRRFGMLMLVYVTGVLIVLGRIAWVQGTLQERYLAALSATVVEYELIPARDGRILAGPSTVLATDVDQYSVQVHYRWLQEPVDETWLKQQTRRQLNSADRRQPELVAAFRQDRLQQRNEMWERLQQLLPVDAEQLNARRQAIRKQVTRIAESVNRRYVSEQNDDPSATAESDVDDSQQQTGMLMRIAGAVRRALTTPPNRSAGERIVVREEESWHSVADNVPLEIAAQIRENAHLYPGVRVVAGNQRSYPGGNLAAHVVGSRTPARDDEPQLWEQSVTSDSWKSRIGRTGVERSYHHQLKSIPGLRQIERNRRFEILREEVVRLPVAGQDLHLTLDARLQQFAEQALGQALLDLPPVDEEVKLEKDAASSPTESDAPGSAQPVPTGGCVVVMNVSTGELLVAASAPAFDLNMFVSGDRREWERVNADQRHPFLSRVTSTALPPGSVIKPLTAVAGIESGHLNPQQLFHCQGYLNSPDALRCLIYRMYGRGHGDVDLRSAIAQSCNVYFFDVARRTGFGVLKDWFRRFGLGEATGVDLPFEQSGTLPGPGIVSPAAEEQLKSETPGMAIGQSRVTVTPLQVARAMAAIANGGWLVTPHVVSDEGTAHVAGDIDDRPGEIRRYRIPDLKPSTLAAVRSGLEAAVQDPSGTGYRTVHLPDIPIAGKTGTAETGGGRPDHAWFAGYVPANQPRYAIVVVLEHGGSGSRAAGAMARDIIRNMQRFNLLQ